MIIYREHRKNDPHAITSQLRGHLHILGNKNPDVNRGERGSNWGKKFHELHFRFEIDLHSYFHATCALLFKAFQPLKVGMTRLGQKFELLIQ